MSETFKIVKLLDPVTVTNVTGGLTPRGVYAGATDYGVGDEVSYNGSSYVMYVDAPAGTLPTDTTKWSILASKGDTGATGSTGAAGVVQSVVAGANVTVDSTDPANPIVAAVAASGITRQISSISTNTTAGSTGAKDYVYLVSGTTTLTLPTAVGNTNRYTVTNVGTNTVTVATTSAQTINGSSTATLPLANMSLDFVSNNSNWIVE